MRNQLHNQTKKRFSGGSKAQRNRDFFFESDDDPYEKHLFLASKSLASHQSKFQDISIIRSPSYGKMLLIDKAIQSAEKDEYVYHEALIHPGMLAHPHPESVLILGGGEGASLREVLRYPSVLRATMVDIDGELVELCRKHLPEWSAGAYEDPRASIVITDGKAWIEEKQETYDVIFMDLTDLVTVGASFHLYSLTFFNALRRALNPGGVLVVQASELSILESFSHCCIRKTMARVFPAIRTYLQYVPSFFSEWSFIVATDDATKLSMSSKTIDRRIAERLKRPLRFYDGESHFRMFSISKDLQAILKRDGLVLTSAKAYEKAYEASLLV